MDLYQDWIEVGLRMAAATACGGLVGWDREKARRPAGLRTLTLVALGAASFGLMADELVQRHGAQVDPAKLIAGVVGGVGFLGAGTIMQSRGGGVQGVTTAASIWVVAGLGSACGLGFYPIAVAGLILTMAILWLGPVEKRHFREDDAPHPGAREETHHGREA